MNTLKISLVQSNIFWENISANLAHLEEQISLNPCETDLIILPEMFATGFTMNVNIVAETMNGQIHNWLKLMANRTNAAICGSFICKENGKYYNRFLFVEPTGKTQSYDKKHLFRLEQEPDFYTSGVEKIIIEYKNWKILPLICYDLRFPSWSSNKDLAYDLLIYVASWPEKRTYAWDQLLKARAIENQSYVIGVNRVGNDGNNLSYIGHSTFLDFYGKDLIGISEKEAIFNHSIDKKDLVEFREKFPFYLDID